MTFLRVVGLKHRVTINGLPFLLKRPTGYGDIENLDHYYQDCVIRRAGRVHRASPTSPSFRGCNSDQVGS